MRANLRGTETRDRFETKALTFGGLRTKDKYRMRSIGGRVLLIKPIRLRKKSVNGEYQFPSIDKRSKPFIS